MKKTNKIKDNIIIDNNNNNNNDNNTALRLCAFFQQFKYENNWVTFKNLK